MPPELEGKPLTILLVNFHSAQNAGDRALLEAAMRQLRAAFHQPRLVVSANYPEEPYFVSNQIEVLPSPAAIIYSSNSRAVQVGVLLALWLAAWIDARFGFAGTVWIPPAWRAMLVAYRNADLVVGCPGNQFFSMGRFGWPLLVSGLAVELAHIYQKSFYVLPQSFGPLRRGWERRWMRHLYEQARLLFLRDPISFSLADEIGIPASQLRLAPDLAFEGRLEEPATGHRAVDAWVSDENAKKLGVTVIRRMVKTLDPDVLDRFYQALSGSLSEIARRYSCEVFFFPQVTGPTEQEDDRVAARQVAQAMSIDPARIHLLDEPLSVEDLKSLYGCMDLFVASRLHSGIFAMSAGVPTLFIGYLTKTRGVLQELDLGEWVIDLDQTSERDMTARIENLWLQREEVRLQLAARIPELAEKARQATPQIAQDYYHDKPS